MSSEINTRLKNLRKKANITQTEMAEKLDMKVSQYAKIERNSEITCTLAKKIADIIDANILEILYDDFERKELRNKSWFIKMINDYTSPYIIIHEQSPFEKEYMNFLKNKD